jgi:uncharacterized protein (DUF2141 family)
MNAYRMFFGEALSRRLASLGGVVALSLVCGRSAVAEENLATNVIEFETQNRNDAGVVRCGLFKEAGWLKDAVRPAIVKISKTTALCVFKEIPAGTYGISAFHDEDNNGKLNTNLVGYPLEEYCSSKNARNMFSAPSWKDAKFSYKGGTLRLRGVMK